MCQPWKDFVSVTFARAICSDFTAVRDGEPRCRISLSSWSFRVLIVEAVPGFGADQTLVELLLEPDVPGSNGYLESAERIELRLSGTYANALEQDFRGAVKKRVARGLSSLEKRRLPLFVFVFEDGKERRFEDLGV